MDDTADLVLLDGDTLLHTDYNPYNYDVGHDGPAHRLGLADQEG